LNSQKLKRIRRANLCNVLNTLCTTSFGEIIEITQGRDIGKKGDDENLRKEEKEFLANEIKHDIDGELYHTLEWLLDEVCNLNFNNSLFKLF
jgi:hypothetical protein